MTGYRGPSRSLGPPQYVSFSPDSRTAYVSVFSTNGSVHLIAFVDTATGAVTATVKVNNHTPGPSATSRGGRSSTCRTTTRR